MNILRLLLIVAQILPFLVAYSGYPVFYPLYYGNDYDRGRDYYRRYPYGYGYRSGYYWRDSERGRPVPYAPDITALGESAP